MQEASTYTSAQLLGLSVDAPVVPPMLLVQLPSMLPFAPIQRKAELEQAARRSRVGPGAPRPGGAAAGAGTPGAASLADLPSCQLGKLLVFRSGAVKLQCGDVLFDVGVGLPVRARQEPAAINSRTSQLSILGSVGQRMVVSPNVWQLMDPKPPPEFERGSGVAAVAAVAAAAALEGGESEVQDGMEVDHVAEIPPGANNAKSPTQQPAARRPPLTKQALQRSAVKRETVDS